MLGVLLTNMSYLSNDASELRYVDDAYFFSESLDTELYSLEDLRTLHLQFSGLKGKIPPGLSGLKNLKALK